MQALATETLLKQAELIADEIIKRDDMIKIHEILLENVRMMRGQRNEYFKATRHVLADPLRLHRKWSVFADTRT